MMNYRSTIQHLTSGEKPIRFNRVLGKVNIDTNWELIPIDSYLVLEGWSSVDHSTNNLVWSEEWLQNITVQLIKQLWGQTLKKYSGAVLPGGLTIDAQTMYQEATDEITQLESEMINSYSLPVADMIG